MKKILPTILAIIVLLVAGTAYATPTSWDYATGVLQPLMSQWGAQIKGSYFTATSTTATSTFPVASTTKLCIANDCTTSLITSPVSIANGGTATTTQVTNGVNYFDGTRITSGTAFVFNGTNVGIATTTPFWALTVASSTGPQLALVDTTSTSNAWTFRSIANSLYVATSTATATSTTAAQSFDTNGFARFGTGIASTTVFETIRYAENFAGSDIGAKINAAYASLPSTGGTIVVPSGNYSFSTAISISTVGKTALIQCASSGGGTTLTYTGTASSTLFNAVGAASEHEYAWGMRDCKLAGPSSSGTTGGIEVGGANGGEGILLEGVEIEGFGIGLAFASNTYDTNVSNSHIRENGKNFVYYTGLTNAGERLNFTGVVFADSNNTVNAFGSPFDRCVDLQSDIASINFTDVAFDDCHVYVGDGVLSANIKGGHFENPGAIGTSPYIYVATSTTNVVNVTDTMMMNGASTAGTTPSAFIRSYGTVNVKNVSLNKNGSTVVANFIHNPGSGSFTIDNLYVGGTTAITNLYNGISVPSTGNGELIDWVSSKLGSWGIGHQVTSDNYLRWFNGGDNRMTLDSSGNFGIATTTPWRTLSVVGTVAFNGLTLNTGAAAASLCLSSANDVTRNTDNETCLSSSRRYKHDIETLLTQTDRFLNLRPVTFEYNDQKGTHYGLIAEEVNEIDSRLVSVDDQGLPNGIRWSHITAWIIEEVQKLIAHDTDQDRQIAELRREIAELRTQKGILQDTAQTNNMCPAH